MARKSEPESMTQQEDVATSAQCAKVVQLIGEDQTRSDTMNNMNKSKVGGNSSPARNELETHIPAHQIHRHVPLPSSSSHAKKAAANAKSSASTSTAKTKHGYSPFFGRRTPYVLPEDAKWKAVGGGTKLGSERGGGKEE
ncbi:hypothetical protein HDV05_000084 [Chytridiales sp. JEL 0842]|nr:hypothetical protein HDV05_000084 [Chytridiales sp. JEL 0842]